MNTISTDVNGKSFNKIIFVAVMLFGAFCVVLNQTILATAYPTIMNDFNISVETVEWLTTAFLLVNGITLPFSSILMKKINSKYLFLSTMTIFLIGTIVCALAPNYLALISGRIIQAIGVGIIMPLLQTSLLTIFSVKERGVAMGFVGLVIALAPSIGPTLSGFVVDNYSWRVLFLMIIPIVVVDIIASFFFLRKVIPLTNPKVDLLSGVLSTVGFGGLLYGFSIAGNKGWLNFEVLAFILVSIVIIAIFCLRQLRIPNPLLRIKNFKYKVFTVTVIVTSISYMAMLGFEAILPLFLQKVRGASAFHAGLLLLPGALIMGIMSPITGLIFDKYGAKKLATVGLTLLSFGTFSFLFISDTTSTISITVLYAIRLFGISMVLMPVSTLGLNKLPNKYLSDGTAITYTLRQLASSIGTAIMVSTLTAVTLSNMPNKNLFASNPLEYSAQTIQASLSGYQMAFTISFVLCVLAVVLTFTLPSKEAVETTDNQSGKKGGA